VSYPLGHRYAPLRAACRNHSGPRISGSSLPLWLFLISGQRSSFQRLIASSLRWLARWTGFWLLQPQVFRIRPTWEGWYETPNWSRMSWAIRGWVQMSPRKPKDSAPCASSSGSWERCSGVSRGEAPGAFLRSKAWIPPSLARFSHWLTAPWVTPRASAMACCFQPFCLSSQARRRRPSR